MTDWWALTLGAVVATIGVLIDVGEIITARRAISRAFDPRVLAGSRAAGGWFATVWSRKSPFVALQAGRSVTAVTCAGMFLAGQPIPAAVAALATGTLHLISMKRLVYGLDGADQMHSVMWFGLALSAFSPAAALTLIAGQSLLSYEIAGIAKLAGPTWRSGQAAGAIASTSSYGTQRLWPIVARWSLVLSWATILFEIGGPLLALVNPIGALLFVVAAVGFHIGIAVTMGLNNFVWAFGAALPAVVWLSGTMPWAGAWP